MKAKLLIPLLAAGISTLEAAATPLKFSSPPALARFSDGALEWSASLNCADPTVLSGARVFFSFDFDLDGLAEGNRDSIMLSTANCENGKVKLLQTFFPPNSGLLTAELRQGDDISDQNQAFTGGMGSVLSLHRFCARPGNGEPEWIEVQNSSATRIVLAGIKVEGHALRGALEPGASVVVGRDSLALREWQPGADVLQTSWSSLRNTGDTLRLTLDSGIVLDSIIYGSAAEPREACASNATEENIASASGYGMDVSRPGWNPRIAPLEISIQAPAGGFYDLRIYDLDGFELCAPALNNTGPARIQFSASDCRGLANRAGPVLLQLRPRASAPLRKIIRVLGR